MWKLTEKFLNFQTVDTKLFGLALFQFFSSAAIIYYLQKSIIIIQIKQKSECRDNSKNEKIVVFQIHEKPTTIFDAFAESTNKTL